MKTKTRFHKLTAWFLTLAMLMTFMPSFTLGVSAAEDTHTHPICCDNNCTDHTTSQAWTAWNESGSLPTASGYYYLTTDVQLTAKWSPADGTYLCLNGKVIEGNGSENVISVNESFTLTDCDSQATHKFSVDEDTGLWTLDEENGTKTVTGGVITGGNTSEYGGGVFVNEFGTFNMYGGAISGNVAYSGGGVCVFIGTFTMTGGTISDNTADWGGGVDNEAGTFIMSGGTISGNTAIGNGGVSVAGTFTMTGGEISGNTASAYGSGVVFHGGTFNLSGTPVIKDNSVDNILILPGLSITVNGALTDGANIGVRMDGNTGTFAQPDGTNITSLADYKDYFSSDASGYEVAVNGNNLDLVGVEAPTYTVAIADTTNGTVTADKENAAAGDTVTITVTPNTGMKVDTITVRDKDGNPVEITNNGNGNYTYTQPDSDVTVTVTFKAVVPAICTVTFDANGGTDAPTYATTGADGKLTEFPASVREGYIFNGWFDAAEGGNAVTLDTIFTENTTIYAHWTLKKYEIYVGGEQVTAENAADVLGDGTVSYNAKTNTLTLNNANLTSGTNLSSINVATLFSEDDLNIELKGTNKITAPDMTGLSNGIFVISDLTIFGSGSLTVIGGNVSGVAEMSTGYFANSNGIGVMGLLTIRTAEVNAIGGTVSVTGDTIVESSDDSCLADSSGILSYSDLVLEDGAKINAIGGNVSINTANDDVAASHGINVYYGDTVIHDAVLNAAGGKVIGGEKAYSYGISTFYSGVKVCDSDAKVTLTSGDTEGTETSSGNGICVYGGDLDIQAGSVSVTSGKRNEDAIGDNAAVYVKGHTDESNVLQGGNLSLASGMKISSPANGTVKKIDDTYYTIVDNNGNIATNVKIEVRKKSYGGGYSSSSTTTTTKNDDGSTTKTTTNKSTGTTTETTTYPDGSTTTVETKKDGTVTTTEKDSGGNTTTTIENPDGTYTTTEKNKDGSETVVEKDTDGTTTTTKKDSEGNKTITTEKADGTTTTEEIKKDGTKVTTETNADGETTAEVETKGETEVVIPVDNADEVTKVVVTDKDGNETEVEFEVKDGGIAISVSGNSTVSVQTGHTCYAKDFTDVDLEAWYHLNVDYVLENGLFKGTTETTFAPNANLTRAMLVTVLYRTEGEPKVSGITSFADLEKGQYYLDAVCWAQINGIVNGVSETEFAPNDYITREQIAAIMHRYAQYKGYDVSVGENTNILSYTDVHNVSEYAIGAMQYAVGSGLIKGKTEATLNPLDNATRAEAAAILERFIKAN